LRKSFPAAEVAAAAGAEPIRWEEVAGGGWGINKGHWRVELADGRRAFAKVALDAVAADWIRDELRVYESVRAPFVAEFLGCHDDGETLLLLEDLRDAYWPPPWRDGDVDAVLATLEEVAAAPPPSGLRRLESVRRSLNGWIDVAEDSEPLLSTGLCSAAWLERSLPALLEVGEACELRGDSLVHLDVRSDNLCLDGERVVLVDWNLAAVGNPLLDTVAWLPSLRLEGGPEPWEVVADSRGLAALIAGFFASRAGLPIPETAPRVREFQRAQAEVALPWAARELDLPPILAP
jgi:hypothetical protein